MECCRLTLLVLLLATSALLASSYDNCNPSTHVQSGGSYSLSCATFVKTENDSISFAVTDSHGTWNVTFPLDGCFPTAIGSHELLIVQVTKIGNNKFHFKMCVGDCVKDCIKKRMHGTAAYELNIRKNNEEVVCKRTYSRPLCVQYNISNTQRSSDTLEPIGPSFPEPTAVSSSSATPLPSPEHLVAPGKATKKFPKSAVVFMVVEVVELVMTCVLGVVLVLAFRRSRRSVVTPASTTVRRVATDDIYISQNSLYEPFCGNVAAVRHDAQEP